MPLLGGAALHGSTPYVGDKCVRTRCSETTDFRPDQFMGYRISAWKRSISQPIDIDKRISLITAIFSNHGVAKVAENLCRDDAQAFVDVVDEVLPHPSVQGK